MAVRVRARIDTECRGSGVCTAACAYFYDDCQEACTSSLASKLSCSDAALFGERQAPSTPAASSKAKLEGEPLAIVGERGPKGEKFFHLVQVR